jgi:hypothetical protein
MRVKFNVEFKIQNELQEFMFLFMWMRVGLLSKETGNWAKHETSLADMKCRKYRTMVPPKTSHVSLTITWLSPRMNNPTLQTIV